MEFDEKLLERKKRIKEFISSQDYVPLKRGEIRIMLQVPKEDQDAFEAVIDSLISSGEVYETRKGKIVSTKSVNLFPAVFMSNAKGFGFARLEDSNDNDIYSSAGKLS